jgi:hypothetical protein
MIQREKWHQKSSKVLRSTNVWRDQSPLEPHDNISMVGELTKGLIQILKIKDKQPCEILLFVTTVPKTLT